VGDSGRAEDRAGGAERRGEVTLLRLIVGELQADEGFIVRRVAQVGYLAQTPCLDAARTVWEEALSANAELHRLEAEMRRLEARLGDPAVYNDERQLARAMAALTRAQEEFEQRDGYRYETASSRRSKTSASPKAISSCRSACFPAASRRCWGWRSCWRCSAICCLLDERTTTSIWRARRGWKTFIRTYPRRRHHRLARPLSAGRSRGGIAELEDHHLTVYQGNYSAYSTTKQLRLLRQQQMYAAQQKEIAASRPRLRARVLGQHRH
jgi:ATP-binding cassette subfamily F protein 3